MIYTGRFLDQHSCWFCQSDLQLRATFISTQHFPLLLGAGYGYGLTYDLWFVVKGPVKNVDSGTCSSCATPLVTQSWNPLVLVEIHLAFRE